MLTHTHTRAHAHTHIHTDTSTHTCAYARTHTRLLQLVVGVLVTFQFTLPFVIIDSFANAPLGISMAIVSVMVSHQGGGVGGLTCIALDHIQPRCSMFFACSIPPPLPCAPPRTSPPPPTHPPTHTHTHTHTHPCPPRAPPPSTGVLVAERGVSGDGGPLPLHAQ
jgi:hypothetical protein